MKRRALISATAVMLVALMCLVTASYAWFTAAGEAKIEAFDVKVEGADAALQLSIDGSNYFSTLTKADFAERGQVFPETLKAVSTADGENFFADEYANNVWTGVDAEGNEYIAMTFWAKAPVAGTANFNIDFAKSASLTDEQLGSFKNAVKIAYAVGEDAELGIYDITVDADDKYQPMIAEGAQAKKLDVAEGNYFVPVDDEATGFGAKRTQTAWSSQTISFAKATPQKFTVKIWLEGMDRNCTGSFDMNAVNIAVGFSGWTAA